jgi:hypothetical protein
LDWADESGLCGGDGEKVIVGFSRGNPSFWGRGPTKIFKRFHSMLCKSN